MRVRWGSDRLASRLRRQELDWRWRADFLNDKSSLISLRAGGGGRRKEGGGGMSIRDTEGVTLNNLRWKGLSSIFRNLTSGGGQRLLKLFVFIIDF